MLRFLRRKLDYIRYHSASRPVNRWSRAIDVAFIVSFLLAFPAAWVADFTQRADRPVIDLSGIFSQSTAQGIEAWLMNPQVGRSASGRGSSPRGEGDETIIGNFNLSVADHLRGWPFLTTIQRRPARLNIDIIREVRPRTDVPRDVQDAYQRAIQRALEEDDRFEALAAWEMPGPRTQPQWWAWFPAIGAWWLMLFFIAAFVIQFMRFGWLWLTRKRLERQYARRSEGKCIVCGYDMTGLEFNERCPECGAQVW